MKKNLRNLLFIPLLLGLVLAGLVRPAHAQEPEPTATPPTIRPLMIINYYNYDPNPIVPGKEFSTRINLRNIGTGHASNVIVTFESPEFYPLATGGTHAFNRVVSNNGVNIDQTFLASNDLWGRTTATLVMKVSFVDSTTGAAYNDTFNLTYAVKPVVYVVYTPTPTPTTPPMERPQLVVDSYTTSVDPLQPGTIFDLDLKVRNLGNGDAKGVLLVLGGGSIANNQGTPQPGVQASGSDLTNFAPLGNSNVVYIGDIPAGSVMDTSTHLIVNSSTQPAAYPFKLSFIYSTNSGLISQDDQAITLLVFNLPKAEISFYRDPDMLFANEMGSLPIQVTNLGKNTAVLGNLIITSENAEVSNNTSLVGMLEPGGYFTLDVNVIPFQPGPLEIVARINFTDDFNQLRTIEQVLTLDVGEQPIIIEPTIDPNDPNYPPIEPPAQEEDFGQKLLRFLLGLFGLDSAAPQEPSIEVPPMEEPIIEPGPMGPKG